MKALNLMIIVFLHTSCNRGTAMSWGNRLNVHQMKCIRKIPVGEGGTDKHTNIAFISEEVWRAVMTEDISETIRIMKKFGNIYMTWGSICRTSLNWSAVGIRILTVC